MFVTSSTLNSLNVFAGSKLSVFYIAKKEPFKDTFQNLHQVKFIVRNAFI